MRHQVGILIVCGLLQACSNDGASEPQGVSAGGSVAQPAGAAGTAGSAGGAATSKPELVQIDRSHLKDTGSAALDYSDPALWVCRPGNDPNECHRNLDATEILKDGSRTVIPHVPAEAPEFDCFYVYPTVATMGGGNMRDFSDIKSVLDPLLSQGARFSRICEVYAPLYRQVSLSTDTSGTTTIAGDAALAVNDVLAAFDHFASKTGDRKFVILGHSQGTSMSIELLKRKIDTDPVLRARMLSAVLLGGAPRVPAGQKMGGSFQNIPTCDQPGQVGCLIAYVTYDQMAPPGANARFGKTTEAGEVACTEPARLAGNTGNYRGGYFSLVTSNPTFAAPGFRPTDVTTRFLLYRDFFKGSCVARDGFNYLELSIAKSADDTRETPPYRSPALETNGWGLHLVDYNPELEDLIEMVKLQAAAAR